MDYVERKGIYEKVLRVEAVAKGWMIVKSRWVDVNKGDEEKPKYRSRLVAMEVHQGKEEGLFAGTPPLEGLTNILSKAATVEVGKVRGWSW